MNRLKNARSPYLRQHMDNPVDWHEWNAETLARARAENKPILLSGGYSACHWCHVMAHESFEDADTAAVMNAHFINIKIDREERPDLDHLYQQTLALMGEPGGWPLTMFLTPDGAPFFGGTYFPPEPKYGRPSFRQILHGIASSWENEQDTIIHNVDALMGALREESRSRKGALPTAGDFTRAAQKLISGFDPKSGGFGSAPKFPQAPLTSFLLNYSLVSDDDIYRKAALITLDNICQGGIYDHLGGGFFRYSTDEYWLVPHFEKMLYDNALLVRLLLQGYKITQNRLYKTRALETVQWLFDEMQIPDTPCFAAALDADSEGEEGKYYVWQAEEIEEILEPDFSEFSGIYDVRTSGNWEGKTVLNRLKQQGLYNEKKEQKLHSNCMKLKAVRDRRVRPARDDKILTDWNAMTAVALIEAGLGFDTPAYVTHAAAMFDDLAQNIAHCRINGVITAPAQLDDYAWLMLLAIKLYQARQNPDDLKHAQDLYKTIKALFADPDGGHFMTQAQADIALRVKTANDTAVPSGNAVLIEALTDLAALTDDAGIAQDCETLIESFAGEIDIAPYALGGYLDGALKCLHSLHITLSGPVWDDMTAFRDMIARTPLVHAVIGFEQASAPPVATVCYGQSCQEPVNDPKALKNQLEGLYSPGRLSILKAREY